MKKLLIIADYNDADYVEHVVRVEDEVFEKFLPLMKAINNFEPYVCRSSFGSICDHNWISPREDLGEKNIYETYPQFSKEYIDEFIDTFMSGMDNPEEAYGGTFHTIVEISDLITDEKYVDWQQDWESIEKKYNSRVKEYLQRRKEIFNYRRGGRSLDCIPWNELTDFEKGLLYIAENLWKDYQE